MILIGITASLGPEAGNSSKEKRPRYPNSGAHFITLR